ncbi:MAG: hypothetical protein R6U56_07850 [Opitutales bacterium]
MRVVDKIPFATIPEQPFSSFRVVGDVLFEALSNDQADQRLIASRLHYVRNPVYREPDKISRRYSHRIVSDHCYTFPGKHVDTILLVVVEMIFRRIVPGLYADHVHADILQANSVAQRPVDPDGGVIQKMGLLLTLHFGDRPG